MGPGGPEGEFVGFTGDGLLPIVEPDNAVGEHPVLGGGLRLDVERGLRGVCAYAGVHDVHRHAYGEIGNELSLRRKTAKHDG